MKPEVIRPDDVYYPLISTPFGKVPLVGATMTDEREREIAERYPVQNESEAAAPQTNVLYK